MQTAFENDTNVCKFKILKMALLWQK